MQNDNNLYLKVKKAGCFIWGILAFFFIIGVIMLIVGIVNVISPIENDGTKLAVVGLVGGILSLSFPAIFVTKLVIDYNKYKNGIETPGRIVWDKGEITDKVIRRHIKGSHKSKGIGYVVLSGICLITLFLVGFLGEKPIINDMRAMALAAIGVGVLVLGIKEFVMFGRTVEYYVEEDHVVGNELKRSLSSLTPVLHFAKYGHYTIEPAHFHVNIMAVAILEVINEGDEVFMVYSREDNRLLHIYRKKYWSR